MFSTTTIPLSTNIPSANTSEKSTIMFRVTPAALRIMKLMNMDIGIAIPTKSAFRMPKKNSNTPTTSKTPNMMEFSNSATWVRVWSL